MTGPVAETFATPDDFGEPRSSEVQTSLGEQLGAEAGESFMGGARMLMRGSQYLGAKYGVDPLAAMGAADAGPGAMDIYQQGMRDQAAAPDVSIGDAKAQVKQEGLEGELTLPDQPTIRQPVLDLMLRDARERAQYNAAVNRGPQGFLPGALGFLTQVGVGMVDPVNAAAFSIPVMGEARMGKLLASAGDSILRARRSRPASAPRKARSVAPRWCRPIGGCIRKTARITPWRTRSSRWCCPPAWAPGFTPAAAFLAMCWRGCAGDRWRARRRICSSAG